MKASPALQVKTGKISGGYGPRRNYSILRPLLLIFFFSLSIPCCLASRRTRLKNRPIFPADSLIKEASPKGVFLNLGLDFGLVQVLRPLGRCNIEGAGLLGVGLAADRRQQSGEARVIQS